MYKKQLTKSVDHLAKYFLKDHLYLAGTDISVADLQALCELMQLDVIENDSLYKSNPTVSQWAERVKSRVKPLFAECDGEGIGMMRQLWQQMTSSKLWMDCPP